MGGDAVGLFAPVAAIFSLVVALVSFALWFGPAVWVFLDAGRRRGPGEALLWGLVTLVFSWVGLVVYLLVRVLNRDALFTGRSRACLGCGAILHDTYRYCPHCGRPLDTDPTV
jgi:hypothetical protein